MTLVHQVARLQALQARLLARLLARLVTLVIVVIKRRVHFVQNNRNKRIFIFLL